MALILVIEDNDDIRENTAELLELKGYTVISAINGRDGLEVAHGELPDLILCDIQMPEIDGYEVFRVLQDNEATARIPFVFLTARAEKKEIKAALDLGVRWYIPKPFEPQQLYAVIEQCLPGADSAML